MTIEQATVKVLSQLDLEDELAIDCRDLAIVSVIGYVAVRRILNSSNDVFVIHDNLIELFNETDSMDISEMVHDFLTNK